MQAQEPILHRGKNPLYIPSAAELCHKPPTRPGGKQLYETAPLFPDKRALVVIQACVPHLWILVAGNNKNKLHVPRMSLRPPQHGPVVTSPSRPPMYRPVFWRACWQVKQFV